jgi:hypothetical protein
MDSASLRREPSYSKSGPQVGGSNLWQIANPIFRGIQAVGPIFRGIHFGDQQGLTDYSTPVPCIQSHMCTTPRTSLLSTLPLHNSSAAVRSDLGEEKKRLHRRCMCGLRKCGCLRAEWLWAHTTGVGALSPSGVCQTTPAPWGLFLLRVSVVEVGFLLFSLCSRILL